jgi:hypothetical protein
MLLLKPLTPLFAVLAAAIVRTDRKIVRFLTDASATSADTAIPRPHWRNPIWRWRLERMEGAGAIRQTSADKLYLDADGWAAYRASRRRRALVVLSIAVPIILLVMFLSG